jgi:hypothetical protein
VGLAATHRLGQLEDRLIGRPLEPAKRLGEQRLHPVRDVALLEEGLGIDLAVNKVRQVENSVTLR